MRTDRWGRAQEKAGFVGYEGDIIPAQKVATNQRWFMDQSPGTATRSKTSPTRRFAIAQSDSLALFPRTPVAILISPPSWLPH